MAGVRMRRWERRWERRWQGEDEGEGVRMRGRRLQG